MSMKKSTLAVALVLGLGLAGNAAAYQVLTGGNDTPEKIATADITGSSTTITMSESIDIRIDTTDFILGRTTGFNVRVSLVGGAKFGATAPTIVLGDDLPTGWTVTLASGGPGQAFAVYAVTPPAESPGGIQPGDLFSLTDVQLTNLTSLQTSGNSVTGQVDFIDPVGASVIGGDSTVLLQSGNPVQLSCDADAGNSFSRIDVGQNESHASKTYFSYNGEIGGLNDDRIDLGDITVEADEAFASFAYTGTDEFTTVVTGNFSAFDVAGNSLYLAQDSCFGTEVATADINTTTNTATFTYTADDAGFGATGGTLALCARVAGDNETVIDATSVSVRTTFERDGVPAVTGAQCSLLPLQYNGSVVRVYNVNPAGNTTAQSFVRVINQSNTDGRVTIVGIDDQGVEHGPISFILNGQHSMQINSDDLENGNAAKGFSGSLGDGAGKWRLFVTGEFSGMVVQSLNRNATDGTVTNLTDADTRGEQTWSDIVESESFFPGPAL